MDALTHMLTDPLEPKEENDGQITEECLLGNCRVNLPEDLLEDVSCPAFAIELLPCLIKRDYVDDAFIFPNCFCFKQPEIFFSVMSESTWSEVLSDAQRQHLRQFLPQFPGGNVAEQDITISDLFNNRNFNFGNPLHLAQRLFRGAPSFSVYYQHANKSCCVNFLKTVS